MHTTDRIGISAGRSVLLRAIEPGDADALRAFYADLSPESRRRRFLGMARGLTGHQARCFAKEHGMVAVLCEPGPHDGAIVGHACMPLLAAGVAEVAFAVADRYQGRGVGRALLRGVIVAARRLGIRRLVASMFADNAAIHRLLLGAGLPHHRLSAGAGVDALEIEVAIAPDGSNVGMPNGMANVGPWVPQSGRTAPYVPNRQAVR